MRHRLLGISGSLRKESTSAAVLRAVAQRCGALTIFPLHEIPLYNADLDGESPPAPVAALKRAIAECEGMVIVSPEYNYGLSGVLKNALDWASRPGYKSVLKDKPVLFMTSSPASTGGVRAHAQLRQTLAACLSILVPGPEIAIAAVDQKIQSGRFEDEATFKLIDRALQQLATTIAASARAAV